jgi:hypothetical protein
MLIDPSPSVSHFQPPNSPHWLFYGAWPIEREGNGMGSNQSPRTISHANTIHFSLFCLCMRCGGAPGFWTGRLLLVSSNAMETRHFGSATGDSIYHRQDELQGLGLQSNLRPSSCHKSQQTIICHMKYKFN